MSASTSRQKRRALSRHAAGVDLVTHADKVWFEQHSERQFRIRRMTAAEIGTAEALHALKPLPQGAARFTLVRKLTSDCRSRIFILGSETKDDAEIDDEVAATLWEHHLERSPVSRNVEARLAAALIVQDQPYQGGAA